MKKLLIYFFTLLSFSSLAQGVVEQYSFDNSINQNSILIDTVNNPNCLWQIGLPQKTVLQNSFSLPNCIVTDTINPYPINDTSSFIIKHEVDEGFLSAINNNVRLKGKYFVNTDTLNDFAKIEFSPDNGQSWVLISDDTLHYTNLIGENHTWPNINNLTLTGDINNWENFDIILNDFETIFSFQEQDTVLFKFTFISDNIFDDLDGIAFDNIEIYDEETIGNIHTIDPEKNNIFPNPFSNQLTLNVTNETKHIVIYNVNGKVVYSNQNLNTTSLIINTTNFNEGVYFYILSDQNGVTLESGKLVK